MFRSWKRFEAMKAIGYSILMLLCWQANVLGQSIFQCKDLRGADVLRTLFDAKAVNGDTEALWKPNFSEIGEFAVSKDGFCHTRLDTIITYGDQALLVFTTSDGSDCHVCAPDISIAKFYKDRYGIWNYGGMRKNFGKYGSDGKRGEVSVQKAGPKD